jgi:hypothetical protein
MRPTFSGGSVKARATQQALTDHSDALFGVTGTQRDLLLFASTICCLLACAGAMSSLERGAESHHCLGINHMFERARDTLQDLIASAQNNLTHADLTASLGLVESQLEECEWPRWSFAGSIWYWW